MIRRAFLRMMAIGAAACAFPRGDEGEWQQHEIYIDGEAGIAEWWVDGVLVRTL